MELTNKHGYPAEILNLCAEMTYPQKEKSIGVTTLINPPLIRTLLLRHQDQLQVDVDDLLLRAAGEAWHRLLATSIRKNEPEVSVEQFVRTRIDGVTITGKYDYMHGGLLVDHKMTSVWSAIFGNDDWAKQLNVYAELCERNGREVRGAEIHALYRDWSQTELWRDRRGKYPKSKFQVIPIKLWAPEKRMAFIKDRIRDHQEHPERQCTDEERWMRPQVFAVMKKGRKSSIRNCPSRVDAEQYIEDNKLTGGVYIEERPKVFQRCEQFCDVRSVCPYAKERKTQ